MEDFRKSGKIAAEAREYGKKLVKEGVKHLEIAEKIEAKIKELGGECAFPVDVSVNYVAAHDCPILDDDRIIKKGDLVLLDIGVHVNGAVTDTACTVEVGSRKNNKLIEASEEALKEAIKLVKPGVKIREIGKKIQEVIQRYGFSPIKNLSGHGVGLYEIHTDPTIPNFDNGDENKLEKGMIIAIEPFATTGQGKVTDGKPSGVYSLVFKKNIRDLFTRKILKFIEDNHKTLPFSTRSLVKEFGVRAKFALSNLEREGIIKQYNVLPEISKGLVSQAEHTLIVGEEVLT